MYTIIGMSDLRVRNIDEDEIDTVLGDDIEFEGEIFFEQLVLVKGQLKGTLKSSSDVFVGPSAKLKAAVDARVISVKGQVDGDVTARQRLELFASSSVNGNIFAPDMIMQSGARFNGSCRMDGDTQK